MISDYDVKKALKPLKFIFWGGILCVIDFKHTSTVNGSGVSFDFLNDFIGMLMITYGVFKLSEITIDMSYSKMMNFVKIIAVISSIKAFEGHFLYQKSELYSVGVTLLMIAELVAIMLFCTSMITFSNEADLTESSGKWSLTRLLFGIIYVIPLGLFYLASIFAILTRQSFHLNLGPFGLLLIPVFLVPIFFILKSTNSMRNEISGLNYTEINPVYEN